jgi:hypothetical protein
LCPKCTPASKSWRMVNVGSAMIVPFPVEPPRMLVPTLKVEDTGATCRDVSPADRRTRVRI